MADYKELQNAKWIGIHTPISNPMSIDRYVFEMDYEIVSGKFAGIVIAARNKDNYILIETDTLFVSVFDICDNAWENNIQKKTKLGEFRIYKNKSKNHIEIDVKNRYISIKHNGVLICDTKEILLDAGYFAPRKNRCMLFGFKQENSTVVYSNIAFTENEKYIIPDSILSPLGEIKNSSLIVNNTFNLTSVVPSISVKKTFSIKRDMKKAELFATARGFYNVYANEERIGKQFFAPGFTDYRLRIQYQVYDITNMLKKGENSVYANITNGYYSGFLGYNNDADIYGSENSFLAKIKIEYKDGTIEEIATDNTWQASQIGPIIMADYLQGEYYDARNKYKWIDCDILPEPQKPVPTNGSIGNLEFSLERQEINGACEVMSLKGKYLGEFPEGHKIFDLGQNIVGVAEIKLKGVRGSEIKIRYGEMLKKTGEIYVANLRSAANTDVFILAGEKKDVFKPEHTVHGFRYVEITGNGSDLSNIEIDEVTGIVISDISEETGFFECSNPLVNRLWQNTVWGERDNFLLVPTDCPQRNERMGWTGDAQVFARTAAYNMDVYAFMRKWLKDVREAQIMYNKNGAVPDVCPLAGDNRGGCAGWADAAVIVPWEMYRAYGKTEILKENYKMMKDWIDFQCRAENRNFGERVVDGKKAKSDLAKIPYIQIQQRRGDHLTFDRSTPFILSATAYAAYVAKLMSKIAEVLNEFEDKKKYAELFGTIKQAFNEAWVQSDGTLAYWGEMSFEDVNKNYYSEKNNMHPSQTAYALAIDFELIDIDVYPKAKEAFLNSIKERDGKLSVGFLGISHLASALMKCGYVNEVFELLEQEYNPGWLYSVKNGATTIWERWNSYIAETGEFGDVSMNSFNHYSYGAIAEWLFSDVLGINPEKAGYEQITLKPHYGGTFSYAKGYHKTPKGIIKTEWELIEDRFVYTVKVPHGIKTTVIMPNGDKYYLNGGMQKYEINI